MSELNQTIWSVRGPLFLLWRVGGVPLGALLAGIGLLLSSNAKISTVLKFAIGIFLTIIIAMAMGRLGHISYLFGIGGTLILLSFFEILWLWSKERKTLKNSSATADLKLVGYVFMLIAAWFICGMASQPFLKALEGIPPSSPIHVVIFLALGWVFLFLGNYKSRK